MSKWRPERTFEERIGRAMESMQPGTLQGRVGSASPVRPNRTSPDLPPEEDLEDDDETPDAAVLRGLQPLTEYFTATGPGGRVFRLKHKPYKDDQRAVHLYWNEIFQPDDSWDLVENRVLVNDATLDIRAGDVFTVKYWYVPQIEGGGGGGGTSNVMDMQCWVSGADRTAPYAAIIGGGGRIGSNGGSATFLSMLHTDASFYKDVSVSWSKPPGTPDLPTDEPISWFITLPAIYQGARVVMSLPSGSIVWDGGNIGGQLPGHKQGSPLHWEVGGGPSKLFCGLNFNEGWDPPPADRSEELFPSGDFNPSISAGAMPFEPPNNGSALLASWLNAGLSIGIKIRPGTKGRPVGCPSGIYGQEIYYVSTSFIIDLGVTAAYGDAATKPAPQKTGTGSTPDGVQKLPIRQTDVDLTFPFTYTGALQVTDTHYRLYNDSSRDRVIKMVRASVGTPSVGGDIVVDLKNGGETIFYDPGELGAYDSNTLRTSSDHPPIINAGEYTATGNPREDRSIWKVGEYLTVSIRAVGPTLPGADLTVAVIAE